MGEACRGEGFKVEVTCMDGEGTSGKVSRDHFTTKASTVLYPVQGSLKRPNVFNVCDVAVCVHPYLSIYRP